MTAAELVSRLEGVRPGGHEARCPAHPDRQASLSIHERNGKVLLRCHAGCEAAAVVGAMGLTMSDLFVAPATTRKNGTTKRAAASKPMPPPLSESAVERMAGALAADADARAHVTGTLRLDPEVVRQERLGLHVDRGGRKWLAYPYKLAGSWTFANMRSIVGERAFRRLPAGQPTSLYRGDELESGGVAIVTEGEKDAVAALTMGIGAELGGAGGAIVVGIPGVDQWRIAVDPLRGQRQVLVALDADAAGDAAAGKLVDALRKAGVDARRLRPPGGCKDFGDLLSARGKEEALAMILEAAKEAPGSADSEPAAEAGLVFIRACDVQIEKVSWLWDGRLARGKITVIEGDPGTGKTTLALSLAACISTGTPLPGQGSTSATPQTVLVFSGEDGQGDTLRPRLEAAGADLARVEFEDLEDPMSLRLSLPRDVPLLEAKIMESGVALVIIDPVMSYIDPDLDSHKDQAVRQALMPLAAMAQRTRVAVILIRHLNKGAGQAAIYRGGGSIAVAAVARMVLLAAKNPDEPATYILARTKGSLGRPPPALCYSLDSSSNESSQVRWGGTSTLTADDLLAPPKPGPKPETRDQAKRYLQDLLAAGPRPRQEVLAMAAKVNLVAKTVERAANDLGVVKVAHGKERLWALP